VQSVPTTKQTPVEQKVEPKKEAPAPSQASSGMAASGMAAGAAGAAAAAAAAVSAAKAAAASVMPRAVTPAPAPQPQKPAEVATPASPPQTTVTVKPDAPAPAKPADPKPAASQPSTPSPAPAAPAQAAAPQPVTTPQVTPQQVSGGVDDLLRIRAIDAETERGLHGIGIRRFEDIARWTPADINRVNQALGLTGRIDREQWIEQAQILAMGGETYYSRNRAAMAKAGGSQPQPAFSAPAPVSTPAPAPAAAPTPAAASTFAPAAQATAAPGAPTPASAPQPAATAPAKPAAPAPAPTPASQPQAAPPQSAASTANLQGRSVAEMAAAAAAAIAAASASVTRGIRPIEPISPLTRANPNIVMPAKLADAIKENDSKPAAAPKPPAGDVKAASGKTDDLKRIRGVGVLIEKRLNALGITTYSDVANWTSGDIDRISQTLDFKGRIERENWVEQARILSSGGHTEFSRRVDRGDVESSRDDD
ncbi:MAG: hypothetical protein WBP38_15485, partial [Hyphomicrobium sp.]